MTDEETAELAVLRREKAARAACAHETCVAWSCDCPCHVDGT